MEIIRHSGVQIIASHSQPIAPKGEIPLATIIWDAPRFSHFKYLNINNRHFVERAFFRYSTLKKMTVATAMLIFFALINKKMPNSKVSIIYIEVLMLSLLFLLSINLQGQTLTLGIIGGYAFNANYGEQNYGDFKVIYDDYQGNPFVGILTEYREHKKVISIGLQYAKREIAYDLKIGSKNLGQITENDVFYLPIRYGKLYKNNHRKLNRMIYVGLGFEYQNIRDKEFGQLEEQEIFAAINNSYKRFSTSLEFGNELYYGLLSIHFGLGINLNGSNKNIHYSGNKFKTKNDSFRFFTGVIYRVIQ